MTEVVEFKGFPKIPRLFRDMVITEKIDGTNACVVITEDGRIFAQSRKRLITPEDDNFGFARWVKENASELLELGPGYHFGEWYGQGIQRNYGLDHRRFALFNVAKWGDFDDDGRARYRPECCDVVPVLTRWATFDTAIINGALQMLVDVGSKAVPGFKDPEGICVFHAASNHLYKVLLENDDVPKGLAA